ncbi:MAG: GNAT family N-acetyltransferase [Pseudomonadota bacterium]
MSDHRNAPDNNPNGLDAEPRVRLAVLDDLERLVAFNVAHAEEVEDKGLARATVRGGVRRLLEHPEDGQIYICEVAGHAAGTLMLTTEWSDWRNGRFWWIQSVYVDPTYRRRGIYSTLHRSVQANARAAEDCCGIRLYVERDNLAAQAAYRGHGMSETDYLLFEETWIPRSHAQDPD